MDIQQTFQQALAFHQAGRLTDAEGLYRAVLARQPQLVEGHYNLGLALAMQGRFSEAVEWFQRAIVLRPDWAAAHESLANALTEAGELGIAITSFQKAIALRPDDAKTYSNLGAALNKQGNYSQALTACEKAVALNPRFAETHNNLGNAHFHLNSVDQAIEAYQHAIALKPDFADAQGNLGDALSSACQTDLAITVWKRAHALRPNFGLLLKMALVLPPIIRSRDRMLVDRRNLEDAVAHLGEQHLRVDGPVEGIGQTSFYSTYQGFNDRDLQMRIARIVQEAVPSLTHVAPNCRQARPAARPNGQRIRVGFISRFFYSHTIGKVNAGLIRTLDRSKFEVVLVKLSGPKDELSASIEASADQVVVLPENLSRSRQIITDLRLDVLLYADIGMEPFTYLLAFSRLAPVQCALWGHPVTTGIPTMDYYISSVDWEPDAAQTHYSERLVRLKHLPVFYERPILPKIVADRRALGLPDDAHLYICPQSLFKMHPDFDPVLRQILQSDAAGVLLLPQGANPRWTAELLKRFHREMPDVVSRIRFLPRVDHDRFLQILAACEVALDPTPFGGGQTSFDILAVGTPIVSLPGNFMRGRLTYAMYRQMGLSDCIATTTADYVRIAVRLGTDRIWRTEVRSRLLSAHDRLFENPAGVRDLEQFLVEAASSPADQKRSSDF